MYLHTLHSKRLWNRSNYSNSLALLLTQGSAWVFGFFFSLFHLSIFVKKWTFRRVYRFQEYLKNIKRRFKFKALIVNVIKIGYSFQWHLVLWQGRLYYRSHSVMGLQLLLSATGYFCWHAQDLPKPFSMSCHGFVSSFCKILCNETIFGNFP